MGEEMTEQMSEEITKAMDEQMTLEQKYASLVTRRGQLKGLSDKAELAETKTQILVSYSKISKFKHFNPFFETVITSILKLL